MKILNSSGVQIKIYSSSKDMSIGRYSEFQKYLIDDFSFESFEESLKRAKSFSEEDMKDDCETEISNCLNIVQEIKNGVNTKSIVFATLVKEIDGVEYNDMSLEGLKIVCEKLEELDITQSEIELSIEDVKKK